MREIRFRCWDGQKMISHNDIYVFKGLPCYVKEYDHVGVKDGILMQFTGLTDKDGRAIYDLDLVRHNSNVYLIIFSKNLGLIAVMNGEADKELLASRSLMHGANWREYNWIYRTSRHIEVIGNVYESGELKAEIEREKGE